MKKQGLKFALVGSLILISTLIVTSVKAQDMAENVYLLTDDNFDKTIASGIVLVDFWAWWCGPCRTQSPIIDEIAAEIGQKAKIAKVDVDKCGITANRYNIRNIPTIIIFRDGEIAVRYIGVTSKETLMTAINNLIR